MVPSQRVVPPLTCHVIAALRLVIRVSGHGIAPMQEPCEEERDEPGEESDEERGGAAQQIHESDLVEILADLELVGRQIHYPKARHVGLLIQVVLDDLFHEIHEMIRCLNHQ